MQNCYLMTSMLSHGGGILIVLSYLQGDIEKERYEEFG